MNRKALKQLGIGEIFIGFCIVRKRELKFKQNGQSYLDLEIGDRSGRLRAKVWRNAEKLFEELTIGNVIKVKGKVYSIFESKAMTVEKIRIAHQKEYQLEDLIPTSSKNIFALKTAFNNHVKTIRDQHLKQLLEILFPNEDHLDTFLKSAPGKLWHHNYLYGMIEHVICLLDLADVMIKHYPRVNADLLKCGIILHNIGKKVEYSYDGFIDFTTEGRLIGHIVLGYCTVETAIGKIKDFPESLRAELLHLILSHQEGIDKGSPVLPMSVEALILSILNHLDATANAVDRIITNDRIKDSSWTKFNILFNRFIYIGNK
jgi:3'-5' exoribonuclease